MIDAQHTKEANKLNSLIQVFNDTNDTAKLAINDDNKLVLQVGETAEVQQSRRKLDYVSNYMTGQSQPDIEVVVAPLATPAVV